METWLVEENEGMYYNDGYGGMQSQLAKPERQQRWRNEEGERLLEGD